LLPAGAKSNEGGSVGGAEIRVKGALSTWYLVLGTLFVAPKNVEHKRQSTKYKAQSAKCKAFGIIRRLIMNLLLQDIRFGFRMLAKNPVITLVAVLALTLGIGANTAIFSVVHAVMLGSLPYNDADRLAVVWERRPENDQNVINIGNFSDWKKQNTVFSDMAAFLDLRANITGDGPPEEIASQVATPNLFSLLGVNPIKGRSFTDEDAKEGAPAVVAISYGLWQRRYGGDEGIVGRKISLSGNPATIVGVMPPDFGWHVRKASRTRKSAEIWSPWRFSEGMLQRRGRFAMSVARLKPGVTLQQAQAEMDTIAARLRQEYPDFNTNWGVNIVPVRTQFSGELRKPLWILLGAVVFVLLIACANVANLLLARATARKKEIAVRIGLGASRWRIVRQLLTESVLLSAIGGVLGLLVAVWGTRALIAIGPPSLASLRDVGVNLPVLGFTLGVALLTGIIFGLVPAFEAARFNFNDSLKEGGKNIGGSVGSQRFRNVFVVTQVALALLLLVGAGLLLKSLNRLQSVDPGFNPRNLLTLRVSLPFQKYDTDQKRIAFFKQLIQQVEAIPGVDSAGAIDTLPFTNQHSGTNVEIEGRPKLPPGQELGTGVGVTDKNYFEAMQIPLQRGRSFTEQEATEMRHVVVINETFARVNFPGEDPLGKRVVIYMKNENVPTEIIGIVGDSKHMGLDKQPEPMSYWPHPELVYREMTLAIRTSGDAASFAPAVRNVVSSLDQDQPVSDVATMEELLGVSISRSRFNTTLLVIFSIVALVMAAVGTYGVMSYTVSQRTHEIGVRMALGAQRGDVMSLVIKRGVVLGLIGVVVGVAAAVGLTRLLTTLLFEVEPTDARVFVTVTVGSFLITLLACAIPARRATKVDPLKALRYE
jgi:putative ABC transport system permease protein